ncbi:MAG: hypothetical protein Ct9H300mP14_02140 [Gammaproteobacteria bacterium]|nr:MAG: hypothetical protein Ct9H300mP14_02140 [Gammaproteobacteria bacterium]
MAGGYWFGCRAVWGLSFIGMMRLEVENSFVNYFGKDTEIHRGLRVIENSLAVLRRWTFLIGFSPKPKARWH